MLEDAGQVQAAEALLGEAARLYEQDKQDCQRLLADAGVLYERHQAGRAPQFNVFSVLRSESDEVNLHSRFLAALLDHRKPPDKLRANLKNFLETVVQHWKGEDDNTGHEALEAAAENSDFKSDSIRVQRERDNIDILIVNDAEPKWAVAIENKIWAGDQPQQLWRYYDALERYDNRIMLYLTLDGHEPEKHSIYGKDEKDCVPEDRLCLISYRDTLPPWLERCQERAYAEPGLRESIAQYLNLVRKMTGTDWTEEYMEGLKALSVKGKNPRLIHDLVKAFMSKKVDLLEQLLNDIEGALKESIPGLRILPRVRLEHSNRDGITGYVERRHGCSQLGLFYPLGKGHTGASLAVTIDDEGVGFGIACHNKSEHPDVYEQLKRVLKGLPGHNGEWWPWYGYADPKVVPADFKRNKLTSLEWEHVEFLRDEGRRKALAASIARDLKPIWDRVRDNAPA